MELAFRCEFAGVRLHDDGEADFLSRSVRARAFTFGQHVFFRTERSRHISRRGSGCSLTNWRTL